MRNYRDLTEQEIKELAELYPVTTNRELSRRYDISVDAIQDRLAYPNGWKKNYKATQIGNRGGKRLTEQEEQWIIKHFQHTKNSDIMAKFGIGESTLHRLARKHGLRKSKQFMKRTQKENAISGYEICKKHGLYEQNAEFARKQWQERKARGEYMGYMPGVSPKERLGARRWKQAIERSHAKRCETIRKERMRINWGLPQQTKLKLVSGGRKRWAYKHFMIKKNNYFSERGSREVLYDDETVRNLHMEEHAKKLGLEVLPADE